MYDIDRLRNLKEMSFYSFDGPRKTFNLALKEYMLLYELDKNKAVQDINYFIRNYCNIKPTEGGDLELILKDTLKPEFIRLLQ